MTAVGQGAGGFARAGASDGAAPETPTDQGGSAAVRKKKPTATKPVVVSDLVPVNGEADVYAVLDALGISTSKAERIPTLRRAVRELLGHYAGATSGPYALYPRTAEHAATRIYSGWHRAHGPLRSSAGYKEADRIVRPIGYLAEVLTQQACELPNCELGVLIDSGAECATCNYRKHERINNAKAAEALEEHRQRARAVMERQLAEFQADHDEALAENAGWDRRAAAKAAAPAETEAARVAMAAEFAALDAAPGTRRPALPAQHHPAADADVLVEEPDDDGPDEEEHAEDAAAWEAARPSVEYQAMKAHREAARLAALVSR